MPVASIQAPSGAVLEFLVLFAVILLGPLVVNRLGLPGLIGLLLGGFAIGPHGLDLINAGDQTVPALGQLGLLYLMFIAGLELDLHMLRKQRTAAVALGLTAFAVPVSAIPPPLCIEIRPSASTIGRLERRFSLADDWLLCHALV
jgi:Kef-type K+ transport system membrane component KefB